MPKWLIDFFNTEAAGGAVMVLATLLALVAANSGAQVGYCIRPSLNI